jgi:hypothetical protein
MNLARIRAVSAVHPGHWLRNLRPSRRAVGVLSVAAVLTLGIAIPAIAVTGSPSGFESADGNLVLDHSGNTDWNCFVNSDGFAHNGATPSGCAVTSGATQITADLGGEVQWVNGQKFDTQCPALSTGNNPPKDEFTNVASFNDTNASLDTFFYGATIRSTNTGNASGDVEFNQAKGNGTTTAGCRTAGDRLLAYDFLNGGTNLNFHLLTWIDSTNPTAGGNNGTCFVKTDSMPCWGANVITIGPSLFDGQSNQSAIAAADNGISNKALAINQFSEFGINLTQALSLGGKCFAFPQQVWESRSSGSSFTSNPQDIEIEHHIIANCGEVKIIKNTDPRGQNQDFSYTSNLTGSELSCTQPTATSFTLNDAGNTTANSPANTQDCTSVPAGTYTVTEGAEPPNFSLEGLSCTATAGSSGTQDAPGSAQADITLAPQGVVTCTYVNKGSGAILVTKTAKNHTLGTGQFPLAGATFTVNGASKTTDANGQACFDGLTIGNTYTVTETSAPAGYAIDTASKDVTVSTAASCTSGTPDGVSFTDAPLTDISASATSEVPGATNSTITCVDGNGHQIASSGPMSDPANAAATGLKPGTYTCTITIDP